MTWWRNRATKHGPFPNTIRRLFDLKQTDRCVQCHYFQEKRGHFPTIGLKGDLFFEYSVKADALLCFACRKFRTGTGASDSTFRTSGFRDWKHTGLEKHARSKKHIACMALWMDKEHRSQKGLEISTLVNTDQLQQNRYYLSSIVDMIEFLCTNHKQIENNSP